MTTLSELYARITSQPLHDRLTAALVRSAGAAVRDPSASPERRSWATGVLAAPAADARAMNILLTNSTVSAALDTDSSGESIPDSDLEYVLAAEILPLIAPE